MRFIRRLGGLVFLALVALGPSALTIDAEEYFVAIDHPSASDLNDGRLLDRPFKTLNRGVSLLAPGDTLTIQKGIYREVLQVGVDGTPDGPVVVRAFAGHEGKVVIRGSDVVSDWKNDGGNNWSVPWYPLPLLKYPSSYPHVDEYAQRREMVFIDGNRLQQVLSAPELVDDSFWMDDDAQRLRIRFASDPNTCQVEVAVRDRGVSARGRNHVEIRGIRVEHVSTRIWVGALDLGKHGRVEDCRVEVNNGYGITMESNSVITRTVVNNNGRTGINLAGSDGSLIDSSETSHNSWRYGPGWDAGGIKLVSVGTSSDNRIVRHTARHNNGPGIFIDTVNSGNVIEASVIEGNKISQILIEAAIGPNWVVNNLILEAKTGKDEATGIRLLVSRDTHIYNNTIVNRRGSGILITGIERYSGKFHNYAANTHVFNNIVSVHPGPRAIELGVAGLSKSPENLASHRFDNNLYHASDPLMWWKGPFDLADWKRKRNQDLHSRRGPPLFSNPTVSDYSLRPGSPAVDAGRNLPEVKEDHRGRPRPSGLTTDIGAFETPASPPGSAKEPSRKTQP